MFPFTTDYHTQKYSYIRSSSVLELTSLYYYSYSYCCCNSLRMFVPYHTYVLLFRLALLRYPAPPVAVARRVPVPPGDNGPGRPGQDEGVGQGPAGEELVHSREVRQRAEAAALGVPEGTREPRREVRARGLPGGDGGVGNGEGASPQRRRLPALGVGPSLRRGGIEVLLLQVAQLLFLGSISRVSGVVLAYACIYMNQLLTEELLCFV